MSHRLTTAAIVAAVSVLGISVPATAAPPDPKEPETSVASATTGDEKTPLTPEQVATQVAEAKKLQQQLEKDDAELARASSRLAQLAARSNALMSAVTAAKAAEADARKKELAETAKLKKLTAEVAATQKDLDAMAYDAYVNGSGLLQRVATLIDLVAADGERADAAADADFVARSRAADETHFAALAAEQRATAARAAEARRVRQAARAKAEKAQKDAAAAVAEQQKSVLAMQQLTTKRRAQLEDLGVEDGLLGGIELADLEKLTTTPLCTEDNTSYPNGLWPGSALCALDDAPGHMLRPSAARAYNALSAAYRKAHGTNLCITDSYRSLAAQIDVKRRKPTLAAKPGTSQHGVGLAVDLCGGIESFGTPQHVWMQQHAPLFGFYHPAWAEPNGSKPEPWHWEYAG